MREAGMFKVQRISRGYKNKDNCMARGGGYLPYIIKMFKE